MTWLRAVALCCVLAASTAQVNDVFSADDLKSAVSAAEAALVRRCGFPARGCAELATPPLLSMLRVRVAAVAARGRRCCIAASFVCVLDLRAVVCFAAGCCRARSQRRGCGVATMLTTRAPCVAAALCACRPIAT
jgi:hypothetical protein